jgi:LacI family transcriptional regulator
MVASIRDVARASAVHVSTVSRAFSAPKLVNRQTLGRVLAVAAELGYRPSRTVGTPPTRSTATIALVVADLDDSFVASFVKAVQREARQRSHQVYVADADSSVAVEEDLVRSLDATVDGVLMCSPYQDDDTIMRLARDLPVVVVNRTVANVPAVVADVAGGVEQAIEHLVELGHRHLVYVGGPRGSWSDHEIRQRAVAAATARDVSISVLGPFAPAHSGQAAAAAILSGPATGVIACNDLMAVGLLEALRSAGSDVPRDISMIGIDDTPLAGYVGLTTVATPAGSAGVAAVNLLFHQAAGSQAADGEVGCPRNVILPTTLVPRQSTGPAPHGGPARPGKTVAGVVPRRT